MSSLTTRESGTMQRLSPQLPKLAAFSAVGLALCLAAAGPRLGAHSAAPTAQAVAERSISFQDRADGAVVASAEGAPIAVFEGEQGFVRGILRSLARERRGEGVGSTVPFHLTAWADGRVTLVDEATHQTVELEAFGSTNVAKFTDLLAAKPVRTAAK